MILKHSKRPACAGLCSSLLVVLVCTYSSSLPSFDLVLLVLSPPRAGSVLITLPTLSLPRARYFAGSCAILLIVLLCRCSSCKAITSISFFLCRGPPCVSLSYFNPSTLRLLCPEPIVISCGLAREKAKAVPSLIVLGSSMTWDSWSELARSLRKPHRQSQQPTV